MARIQIKPLSVNDAWNTYCTRCKQAKTVKRTKSDKYKQFERDLLFLLPKKIEIPVGKLRIDFIWGFSSKGSDWDNPIKPLQDVLQKKYNFNDSIVYFGSVEKRIVKKGDEFIDFKITSLENTLQL